MKEAAGVDQAVHEREDMAEEPGSELIGEQPTFRLRPQHLLWIVGLGIGVYTLLPRVGQLTRLADIWGSINEVWLLVTLLATALSYVAAAVVQRGAAPQRLRLGKSIIAQLAAMFAGNVGPHQGVGNFYVLERYIEKSGANRRQSITAVTLIMAAGTSMHALLILLILDLLGRTGLRLARDVRPWQIALVVGAVAIVAVYLAISPQRVRDATNMLKASVRDLSTILKHPARSLELFGGSLLLTAAYIAALLFSMRAVGSHVGIVHVAAVYLLGSMIGSASPTPGGLGVLESAFVAGLAAFGVSSEKAVAGVLLYRFLTFWLPILPGLLAFRYLRRENCL